MFRTILTALLSLGAWSAHADTQLFNNAFDSRYRQLHELFQKAEPVTAAQMTGWYSGRCYSYDRPDLPTGNILVTRTIELGHGDDGDGPLFPPDSQRIHQYNVLGLGPQGNQAPADYWDHMTPNKTHMILDLIARGALMDSQESPRSLDMIHSPGNLYLRTRLHQVASQDPAALPGYFITQVSILRDTPRLRAGSIFGMCYFFKQVR